MPSALPRRIAFISVHTSPLSQPGIGDAGGMNVYVWETATCMARRGIAVEIFTRSTSMSDEPLVQAAPGVLVRHVQAGPFEDLDKAELPAQLCGFSAEVLDAEAAPVSGYYDLVHSHYWLSGQVGWLAATRWGVPLVHTAHTLAAVKNFALADGDIQEPHIRMLGEQQIVDAADRLVANTATEAEQLESMYNANSDKIDVVTPGADLDCFTPGSMARARASLGLAPNEEVVAFVGRIQPLKAPDILLRAAAPLVEAARQRGREPLRVLVVGGPSGTGREHPTALADLAYELGIADRVTFLSPQPQQKLAQVFRAADIVAVPSYSESFGLVAIEAQACGTPVLAADVGGLGVAVVDGKTGVLVKGHSVAQWSAAIENMLINRGRLEVMGIAAREHAEKFSWEHTVDGLLASYANAIESHATHTCPGWSSRVKWGAGAYDKELSYY